MSHEAAISRRNPTAFLFLLDQSGSMSDPWRNGLEKADQLADILNRTLYNLVTRCSKNDGVRDYFQIGILGYNGDGVRNLLEQNETLPALSPISWIAEHPRRVEERLKKESDGAGGIFERKIKFPIWAEPAASGGTPMCEAFYEAARAVADFCNAFPASYPPTILHITDGEANDGDPSELAQVMMQLHTDDGKILLYTLHLSEAGASTVVFPDSPDILPNDFAKSLFGMSSLLPPHLLAAAREKGYEVGSSSRGLIFNADDVQLVDFFDIGTRAAQMR